MEASSRLESWLRCVEDRIFSSISPHDCPPCDEMMPCLIRKDPVGQPDNQHFILPYPSCNGAAISHSVLKCLPSGIPQPLVAEMFLLN